MIIIVVSGTVKLECEMRGIFCPISLFKKADTSSSEWVECVTYSSSTTVGMHQPLLTTTSERDVSVKQNVKLHPVSHCCVLILRQSDTYS